MVAAAEGTYREDEMETIDLAGVIDLHVHTAPDVRPRSVSDLEAARQARDAGMRAILIKSHVTCTADRAQIAQAAVGGVRVYGGVVLNEQVGGLNPAAVEVGLALGAAIVWLPTFGGQPRPGVTVLDADGELRPVVREIIRLVRDADRTLATGHIGFQESLTVAAAARESGLRHLLVTHPEWYGVSLTAGQLTALAGEGVFFEHCYLNGRDPAGLDQIVAQIRAVGVESTVLTTDLGQEGNPLPTDGMRAYIANLLGAGFSRTEVNRMAAENPAGLVGL
jgi:hypothetical protein